MALVRLSMRISPSPFLFSPSPHRLSRVGPPQRLLMRPCCSFSTSSDPAASYSSSSSSSSSAEKSSEVAVSPPSRQDRRLWKQPWNISGPLHLSDGLGSFGNALMNLSENLNNLLRNWSPFRLLSRMKEHDDYYKFKIPVPGLGKEDLKVTVDDRYLVITGEHKEEEGSDVDEIDGWYSQSFGYYNTSLLLPDDAKVDEIKAELKNGVLHVTIPRSGEGRKNVREVEIH